MDHSNQDQEKPNSLALYNKLYKLVKKVEKECISFDSKENIQAGLRVRSRLRKVRKAVNQMISETLIMSKVIQVKRGNRDFTEYWEECKKNGKARQYQLNRIFRDRPEALTDVEKAKIKKFQNS